MTSLNIRLLPDGHIAAKAYGRPAAGGRGTYVSFPVPERPELGEEDPEVDAWAQTVERIVIEVHPEVCFATLAGHPLAHPTWSRAGAEERGRLLVSAGIQVPAEIGVAGELPDVDDVLESEAMENHARLGERLLWRFGEGPLWGEPPG